MAEAFHVGEYLQDELDARGWTTRDCAERMGGDVNHDTLALDFLLLKDPAITIDSGTAEGLSRAFGSSAETWMNLQRSFDRAN